MTFTPTELRYLVEQPLGRLATLGPNGPQVSPVAFWVDTDAHRIEISGPNFGASQKVRNIRADSRVSFVVDDMASEAVGPGGQTGRGLEIRARAEILTATGRCARASATLSYASTLAGSSPGTSTGPAETPGTSDRLRLRSTRLAGMANSDSTSLTAPIQGLRS